MIKNAQMTVISPERYNWVSDVLRLDGGEVQDRADHRYRHQCMLPGGHPECPYIGGNARFAIICVIAPTFLPTYLVPTYLPLATLIGYYYGLSTCFEHLLMSLRIRAPRPI